jgi:hypothetical protein
MTNTRKYRVNNIPDNFLVDDAIRDKINETIYRIENAIHVENNVQSAYDDLCILIQDEMDNKLPRTKNLLTDHGILWLRSIEIPSFPIDFQKSF